MAGDVVGGLGKAGELFSDLASEKPKVENEVNVGIKGHVVEGILAFGKFWSDVFADHRENLTHELVTGGIVGNKVEIFNGLRAGRNFLRYGTKILFFRYQI